VQDDSARARLAALLDSELSDARAWELQPDGGYLRRGFPGEKQRTSQEELLSRLSS
jgi:hypothetical protein